MMKGTGPVTQEAQSFGLFTWFTGHDGARLGYPWSAVGIDKSGSLVTQMDGFLLALAPTHAYIYSYFFLFFAFAVAGARGRILQGLLIGGWRAAEGFYLLRMYAWEQSCGCLSGRYRK